MAEILLSLTIIGVVAAITLPSLTGNINERTWNTQRKALYARMSQAISLMPSLNGYGTLTAGDSSTSAVDTAAETFLTDGLAKVLKINNICDSEHLADCGVVTSFTNMIGSTVSMPSTLYELSSWFQNAVWSGSSYSTPDSKAAAFETQNGESIIAYYNQSCTTEYINQETLTQYSNAYGFSQATMCINYIYDLNGSKGPNTIGKDIGIMTIFNATDSIVVAPVPASNVNAENNTVTNWYGASKACTNENSESRLPNINELSSMLINQNIINLNSGFRYWSSSVFNTEKAWSMLMENGVRATGDKTTSGYVRCIKR